MGGILMKPMYRYRATLVRVIDGDTVDFIVDMGFRMTSLQRFRLLGIDTPERGQVGYSEAKMYLIDMLAFDDDIILETAKDPDSFGRWLCTIWIGNANINENMLINGLAVEYKR